MYIDPTTIGFCFDLCRIFFPRIGDEMASEFQYKVREIYPGFKLYCALDLNSNHISCSPKIHLNSGAWTLGRIAVFLFNELRNMCVKLASRSTARVLPPSHSRPGEVSRWAIRALAAR